jgi:hypothetical protein
MNRECRFYYYKVVQNDNDWPRKTITGLEPVKVEGREPLGKPPDYCCDTMKFATERNHPLMTYDHPWLTPGIQIRPEGWWNDDRAPIQYCPWCGANIVMEEHLHLKETRVQQPDKLIFEIVGDVEP